MPSAYKGLTIPDYADAADAPAGFQDFTDSGPIPRFATAAARTSAIPSPVAGQVCYRADAGHTKVEVYDGGVWKLVSPAIPASWDSDDIDWTEDTVPSMAIISLSPAKLSNVVPDSKLPLGTFDNRGIVRVSASLTSDQGEGWAATPSAVSNLRQDTVLKSQENVQTLSGPLRVPTGSEGAPGLSFGGDNTRGIFAENPSTLEIKFEGRTVRFAGAANAVMPSADNDLGLGAIDNRWVRLFAVNGTISTSDPALKNIGKSLGSVLEKMREIPAFNYTWKDPSWDDGNHYGISAGAVAEAFPDATEGPEGQRGLRDKEIIAILWQAVRELEHRTRGLTA